MINRNNSFVLPAVNFSDAELMFWMDYSCLLFLCLLWYLLHLRTDDNNDDDDADAAADAAAADDNIAYTEFLPRCM